jgi:hypothetical protein
MIPRITRIEFLEEIQQSNEIFYRIAITMSDNSVHTPNEPINFDTINRTIEKERPEIVDSRRYSMSFLSKMLELINPLNKLPEMWLPISDPGQIV